MNFRNFIPLAFTWLYIAVAVSTSGCQSQGNFADQERVKDKFIEKQYAPPAKKSKPNQLIKTHYYDEIQAGQVIVGMSLLETQMATKSYPHGPKLNNMVHWCNGSPVSKCGPDCEICAAILFGPKQTHFLRGKGQQLFVEKSIAKSSEDTVFHFKDKPFPVVNALFQNRIVKGMDLRDFERIQIAPDTKQKFFCNNRRVFKSCLYNCGDCTVQLFSPRNGRYFVQTIRFLGRHDFKTIIEVKQSTQASIQ